MDKTKSSQFGKITVDARRYAFFRKVLVFMMVFAILCSCGASITAYADDSDKDSYNLSSIANALSNVFSLSLTPSGDTGTTDVHLLAHSRTGNGGLVVGITGKTTSVGQWIASMISGSSVAYDYISLQKIHTGVNSDNTIHESGGDAAYYYAVFGHLLKDVGLDKTTTNTTGNVHPIRFLAGGLIMVVYWIATLIYKLFAVAINILQAINPFFWLSGIAADYSTTAQTSWGTSAIFSGGGDAGGSGARGVLVTTICDIYVTMANLSWGIVIPLMIALYFFGVFALRKTAGTKRLLIRVVFLSIGIPVMGALYTGFLDDMEDLFTTQTSTCDQVILSTFVDFENWAKYSHLYITNGMTLSSNLENRNANTNATAGTATAETIAKLRSTCLAINKKAGMLDKDTGIEFGNGNSNDIANSIQLKEIKDEEAAKKNQSKSQAFVLNVLSRYMSGDTYTSDSYASYVQTCISNSQGVANGIEPKIYGKFLQAVVNLNNYEAVTLNKDWWKNVGDTISKLWSSELTFDKVDGYDKPDGIEAEQLTRLENTINGNRTIFNDGGIEKDFSDNQHFGDDEGVIGDDSYMDGLVNGTVKFKQATDDSKFGLSTMSMYNYLSTDFTNDSVIVYGGGNAIASGLTQKQHYSINIIGSGIMSFVYWSDCFVLLGCISLIGIFYAFGMISHALRNSLHTITTMPMAMLGSMRYMSKFIGIVITMVANVLITAILYSLAGNFLIGISQFIEAILSTSFFLKATMVAGMLTGLTLIMRFFVMIVFIVITFHLIKIRKQTIHQITEWVQQVVTKFMEADSHGNPDKPKANVGQRILSGVATGAGMAAGNQMAKGAVSAIGGALSGGGGSDGGGSGSEDKSGAETHDTVTGNTIEQEGGSDSYENGISSSQANDNSNASNLHAGDAIDTENDSKLAQLGVSNNSSDNDAVNNASNNKLDANTNNQHDAKSISDKNSLANNSEKKEAQSETAQQHSSAQQIANGDPIGSTADNIANQSSKAADNIANHSSNKEDAINNNNEHGESTSSDNVSNTGIDQSMVTNKDETKEVSKGDKAIDTADKAAGAAENIDKSGTASVAKANTEAAKALKDKDASAGQKVEKTLKAGATDAATFFGGTKAGETVKKGFDGAENAHAKMKSAKESTSSAASGISSKKSSAQPSADKTSGSGVKSAGNSSTGTIKPLNQNKGMVGQTPKQTSQTNSAKPISQTAGKQSTQTASKQTSQTNSAKPISQTAGQQSKQATQRQTSQTAGQQSMQTGSNQNMKPTSVNPTSANSNNAGSGHGISQSNNGSWKTQNNVTGNGTHVKTGVLNTANASGRGVTATTANGNSAGVAAVKNNGSVSVGANVTLNRETATKVAMGAASIGVASAAQHSRTKQKQKELEKQK